MQRQRQRCVLRPLLVPNIEFTAHAVSAQTCWAELTLHSLHSSLLSSLLSIPPLLCHDPAGQPYRHSVVQNGQLCQVQAGSHTHIPSNTHWFYCLPMCVYYIAFSSILFDNWERKTQWINMNRVLLSPLWQKHTWSTGCMSVPLIATSEQCMRTNSLSSFCIHPYSKYTFHVFN